MVVMLLAFAGFTLFDWASFQTNFFAYHYFKNDWQTLGHVQRINKFLAEMAPARISWHVNYPDSLMFYAFDTAFDPANNLVVLRVPDDIPAISNAAFWANIKLSKIFG